MGADQGTKKLGNSDAETFFLSTHRDLMVKGTPTQLLDRQDSIGDDHHDENVTLNIPRSLKPIKIKVESLTSSDDDHNQDADHGDRQKTPTGEQHKIPGNQACPPAPKKQRRPLKRRRTLFNSDGSVQTTTTIQRPIMRLVELSNEEIELMFPRRSSNNVSGNTTSRDLHDAHRPGNIKKVNQANLATVTSFR